MVRFCSCGVMALGCSGESDFRIPLHRFKDQPLWAPNCYATGSSTQDTRMHLRMSVLVLSCRPGIVREYETHAFIC